MTRGSATASVSMDLKGLENFKKAMTNIGHVEIGILGNKSIRQDAKGPTNAEIGIIHEFGGTINHPGGTPYIITASGKSIFVKKGSRAKNIKFTKPHLIKMPKRSWLRWPLQHENKIIAKKLQAIKSTIEIAFAKGDSLVFLKKLSILAEEAIQNGFDKHGWGQWPQKKRIPTNKKGQQYDAPLIMTGQLRNAVDSRIIVKK